METKNKVIIGVAILAIFAVLVFTGVVSTTGKQTLLKECRQLKIGGGSLCVEGRIQGTQANGIDFDHTDYCSLENPKIIVEYSCGGESGWTKDTFFCETRCSQGACKPTNGVCVEDKDYTLS